MSSRARYYPYRVIYVNLQDYLNYSAAAAPAQKLPIQVAIVRAKNSKEAKNAVCSSIGGVVVASAGRYPERFAERSTGTMYLLPTKQQLEALHRDYATPGVFAANNPGSTMHTKPLTGRVMKAAAGVGAPTTAAKSTPLSLSSNSLNVGGFTVGYNKKPGSDSPSVPAPARQLSTDLTSVAVTELGSQVSTSVAVTELGSQVSPRINQEGSVNLAPPYSTPVLIPSVKTADVKRVTPAMFLAHRPGPLLMPSKFSVPPKSGTNWLLFGIGVVGVAVSAYFFFFK